jgi:hypothetical protein
MPRHVKLHLWAKVRLMNVLLFQDSVDIVEVVKNSA